MTVAGRVRRWAAAVLVSALFAYSLLIVSVTVGQPVARDEAALVYVSAAVLCWATARTWSAVRHSPPRARQGSNLRPSD